MKPFGNSGEPKMIKVPTWPAAGSIMTCCPVFRTASMNPFGTGRRLVSRQLVEGGGEPGGEPFDLLVESIDLVEQDPGQLSMVVIEAAVQGFDQGGVFGSHSTTGHPRAMPV